MALTKVHKSIRLYEWSTISGTLCKIENKVFYFKTALKDKAVTCKRCLAKIKKESEDAK